MTRLPTLPRGRGVGFNPPNRFERLHVERDEWTTAEDPSPRTRLLRDGSRTVIARNRSPDIGFEASVNPYRGCEHGCAYCLGPETPVLLRDMSWKPIGDVRPGDALVGFDEYPAPGRTRKLRPARVEAVVWSRKPTVRLLTDHSEIVTTAEHRWLQHRDFRWSRTEQLVAGSRLRRLTRPVFVDPSPEYMRGYVTGMTLGGGTVRYEPGWRSDKLGFPAAYWRVALADTEPLRRLRRYLKRFRIDVAIRPFGRPESGRRPMQKVETRSLSRLGKLHRLLSATAETSEFKRGFLAGFFDAEGSNSRVLRTSQVDVGVLRRVQDYASHWGFRFRMEQRSGAASRVRLLGGLSERIRFFGTTRPAIQRTIDSVFGKMPSTRPEPVRAIEPGPVMDVVDIQTSTGTFYADGVATHNCYARPTHEYLGFSAGLDFETNIVVKEDAPELLRRELLSHRWKPQPIAMSGVTDPYQPVERRLEITRRCLGVLAEFRNPVLIITKNALVTRDVDHLRVLAEHDAALVMLSVTTLDHRLQRVMEPRASTPTRRLRTIETLAKAGIPVGVMVAPVIPGLTDQEVPAILKAVADAGAFRATYVHLRLPLGVAPIFERWLGEHYPERKKNVLDKIRAMRGGRLNDPRFGHRMRGRGPYARQVADLFEIARRRVGLDRKGPELSVEHFRRPGEARQLGLGL